MAMFDFLGFGKKKPEARKGFYDMDIRGSKNRFYEEQEKKPAKAPEVVEKDKGPSIVGFLKQRPKKK